jgi:hypothetical protein
MKTFGELTQIELDETIAKNEYESRLIRAIRARTTGADPQALIKDLIPPDELARMIEEAKESGSSSHQSSDSTSPADDNLTELH